jgi:hypothetical protein
VFCTNCGAPRAEGATACTNCAQRFRTFPPPPVIPNYLVQSVLVTLCCCMPFGIVALVFAAQVNSKLAAGDVAGAQASSRSARTWTIVALIAGLISGAALAGLSLLND